MTTCDWVCVGNLRSYHEQSENAISFILYFYGNLKKQSVILRSPYATCSGGSNWKWKCFYMFLSSLIKQCLFCDSACVDKSEGGANFQARKMSTETSDKEPKAPLLSCQNKWKLFGSTFEVFIMIVRGLEIPKKKKKTNGTFKHKIFSHKDVRIWNMHHTGKLIHICIHATCVREKKTRRIK